MTYTNLTVENCYVYRSDIKVSSESKTSVKLTGIFAGELPQAEVRATNCYYGACTISHYVTQDGDKMAIGASVEKTEKEFEDGTVTNLLGASFIQGAAYPILASSPADYSQVKEQIKEAEQLNADEYEDFSAVETAIGEVIWGKSITEQADVDQYASNIENAIKALVYKKADYAKVNEALEKVKALNREDYKDFSVVDEAVNSVEWEKEIIYQADVDKMAEAIENAVKALEKKEPATTSPTEPADTTDATKPTEPTTPTTSTEPTEPTKPTDPTDTTDVIEPTNPEVTAPGTVVPTVAARSTDTIKISWKKVKGATGYQVYRYDTKLKKYKQLKKTTKTTITDTKLTPGTSYAYKVRAYTVNGTKTIVGKVSKSVKAVTRPKTPQIVSVKKKGTNKADIKIRTVKNVKGYRLYEYMSATKKYKLIGKIEGKTYYKYNSKTKKFTRDTKSKVAVTTKKSAIQVTIRTANVNLKQYRRYRYKVRAYVIYGGKTVFSGYSNIKILNR